MERWREIEGQPGYEVSDLGRVRSPAMCQLIPHPRTRECHLRFTRGLFLGGSKNRLGYISVVMHRRSRVFVHRLVAAAFVENPEGKPEVNHLDSNPSNNQANNLEWCTHKENMRHAADNGRLRGASKLTDDQVREIRCKYASGGITYRELGECYSLSKEAVGMIVRRRNYSAVT